MMCLAQRDAAQIEKLMHDAAKAAFSEGPVQCMQCMLLSWGFKGTHYWIVSCAMHQHQVYRSAACIGAIPNERFPGHVGACRRAQRMLRRAGMRQQRLHSAGRMNSACAS